MKRASGILCPVFSLPSPYGIGTLGKAAMDFIDFLDDAGQMFWQVLPEGPVAFGNSPYQTYSVHAGNPYFIDLDLLIRAGLLTNEDVQGVSWGEDPTKIDYDVLAKERIPLLRKAYANASEDVHRSAAEYASSSGAWLANYALYMALKKRFDDAPWTAWPGDIRARCEDAVERYTAEERDEIGFQIFCQYLFATQWNAVRSYAHEKGIKIIGDLPIYVAYDSADVWAEPQFFQLDDQLQPRGVAGCPPDAFSDDGQHWGNPLYDWNAMKADGYGWWIRRVERAAERYDVLRIDHFRGLAQYWSIPPQDKTAKNGHWEEGPGYPFLKVLTDWFPQILWIAEDLGMLTEDVHVLRKEAGLPGMKVLAFAFDQSGSSTYLPHRYDDPHCVCYTGTHDNAPLAAWVEEAAKEDVAFAMEYLAVTEKERLPEAMLRAGMASAAELFIAQMPDVLGLGADARINLPGTVGENWRWRMAPGAADEQTAARICRMAQLYDRQT